MGGNTSQKANMTSQLGPQNFNPFLPMTQGPNTAAGIYDPPPYTGMSHEPTMSSKEGSLKNSALYEENGITYIIPTMSGDEVLSDDAAIEVFRMTRDHMGGFSSSEAANLFRNNDDEILNNYQERTSNVGF